MIPESFIKDIEEQMIIDENIKINFDISIFEQELDEPTWEKLYQMLDIVKKQQSKESNQDEIQKLELQNIKMKIRF